MEVSERSHRALVRAGTATVGGALFSGAVYLGLVTGAVPVDIGIGRRVRSLGPLEVRVEAPREVVFDVLAAPYAERAPRALREKVRVLERGQDMVLAAHYTPIRGRLQAVTVETVRFERPDRISFRLVRGPVPHVIETFVLTESDVETTRLAYSGELGMDLWRLGELWADQVAPKWESVVASSFETVKAEAERRHGSRRGA